VHDQCAHAVADVEHHGADPARRQPNIRRTGVTQGSVRPLTHASCVLVSVVVVIVVVVMVVIVSVRHGQAAGTSNPLCGVPRYGNAAR
jgi:hypothetical protein